MVNKRKKAQPKTDKQIPQGLLKSGLTKRAADRRKQYAMLARFSPLSSAFDEVLKQLRALCAIEDLDIEIVHLLEEAQRWIISGVDHALAEPTSHEIEEARKLLELGYLFLDFSASPENLHLWSQAEPWNRQSKFGFGELRKREERRQGLSKDMVVAARDYWITHSIHSHPKPIKDERILPDDRSRLLLLLLGDLLGHAVSVVHSAKECVESQDLTISSEFVSLPTDAIQESWARMHEVLHSHIPSDLLEATSQPHPKNHIFSYPLSDSNNERNR